MFDFTFANRKPMLTGWNDFEKYAGKTLYKNDLLTIFILPKETAYSPLREIGFSLYYSPSYLKISTDTISFELPDGFIGVPPAMRHDIQSIQNNILVVSYLLGNLATKDDFYYNKRLWGIDLKTIKQTLAIGHRRGGANGRKFIARSVYSKKEVPLNSKEHQFYVPRENGKFPILTANDLFFSTANNQDLQDYHCHQNSIELVISRDPLDLTYYDFTTKKDVILTNVAGIIVIPSLVYHKVILKTEQPAYFVGIRETDTGTDKLVMEEALLEAAPTLEV